MAFLLNYFWLCQLSWMITEAVTMYIALVKVFGTYIRKALLKYSLAGWGVPLIFPLIGLAWGGTDYADPKTLVQFVYPQTLISIALFRISTLSVGFVLILRNQLRGGRGFANDYATVI